jgi:hypothetical protein
MQYQVILDNVPMGYATTSGRAGDPIEISVRGFVSSEDGDAFIKLLEGFPQELISKAPPGKSIPPSMVDHLLAIVRGDKTVYVYVNELNIIAHMKPKRTIKKGEKVSTRDIADIERGILKDITIPIDTGVVLLLSQGWRKGLYYDFWPINPSNPTPRAYDLEIIIGQMLGYLLFQHLFTLVDDDWTKLFEQQWFPFISLDPVTIEKIISYAKNNWLIDDLLPSIASEVSSKTDLMIARWKANPYFSDHLSILETAIERYQKHDYISCVAALFPRIEGVMRSHHLSKSSPDKMQQADLSKSAIASIPAERQSSSLLLPAKFENYLTRIYFKNFDPAKPRGASRHTVGHGVAPEAEFNMKNATLAILILDQLAFSFK